MDFLKLLNQNGGVLTSVGWSFHWINVKKWTLKEVLIKLNLFHILFVEIIDTSHFSVTQGCYGGLTVDGGLVLFAL